MENALKWLPVMLTLLGWAYSVGVLNTKIEQLEAWKDKTDANRYTLEDAQNVNQLYFYRLDRMQARIDKLEDRLNGSK